jgi:hypothetical protein
MPNDPIATPIASTGSDWQVSSFCDSSTCVQVQLSPDRVQVRDSKNPEVTLTFDPQEWRAFLAGAQNAEFNI